MADATTRYCRFCGETKPLDETNFWPNRKAGGFYSGPCKACYNARRNRGAGAPSAPRAARPTMAPAPATLDGLLPYDPSPGFDGEPFDPGLPRAYAGRIVVDAESRETWAAARSTTRQGFPLVVGVVGPSGAGKTHLIYHLAAEEGLPVVKFDASGVVEPGDWFGAITLDGQGTTFVPSDLLRAITAPGARVLLIDELNRANARATNAMLPLFDGSGTVTIPQTGQHLRVNPNVQLAFTANIGSAFLGVEPLDEAVRTRIVWLEVDHLSESAEAKVLRDRVPGLGESHAANLARLGVLVRAASAQTNAHPPVGTRQLLAAARLIANGARPRTAVNAAVLNGYKSEGGARSERAKVAVHVAGIQWDPAPAPSPDPDPADAVEDLPF